MSAINKKHPLFGLCYVISEALYHAGGRANGYKPCRLRYRGVCHWWLRGPNGENLDLTAGQYTKPFPYHRGVRGGWLTGETPCKRTQSLLEILYGQNWRLLKRTKLLEALSADWTIRKSYTGFLLRLSSNVSNPALHTLRYGLKGSHPRA